LFPAHPSPAPVDLRPVPKLLAERNLTCQSPECAMLPSMPPRLRRRPRLEENAPRPESAPARLQPRWAGVLQAAGKNPLPVSCGGPSYRIGDKVRAAGY
jgi:hypothetical protein